MSTSRPVLGKQINQSMTRIQHQAPDPTGNVFELFSFFGFRYLKRENSFFAVLCEVLEKFWKILKNFWMSFLCLKLETWNRTENLLYIYQRKNRPWNAIFFSVSLIFSRPHGNICHQMTRSWVKGRKKTSKTLENTLLAAEKPILPDRLLEKLIAGMIW
jgi:hypothetical protein